MATPAKGDRRKRFRETAEPPKPQPEAEPQPKRPAKKTPAKTAGK